MFDRVEGCRHFKRNEECTPYISFKILSDAVSVEWFCGHVECFSLKLSDYVVLAESPQSQVFDDL